ncbi:MAG TPA: NAD(P)-dependent oxidoreductase [Ramlibacter sp.]|nr:NAD(P)-dependent oxidoreductase [Ramlibacter sp.]
MAERGQCADARQGAAGWRDAGRSEGMTIGYVGLGSMGGALARRLQLSHPLRVYDVHPEAIASVVEEGATGCRSLRELADQCDVILLCLPTSEHVRSALFGADGLAAGLRPGTVVIDQTSGDPIVTRAIGAELEQRGVALVDAPVSGGRQGAEAGTIAIMVGAAPEHFARIEPVLRAISANVFHAGGLGAGQVIKLSNNLMSAAQRLLTFEAVALAVKNGIEPATACEILLAGGGRNVFLEKFMAPHVIEGRLSSGFTLGLMHKDVRLACQLGSDSGVPMFFGGVTREFYQLCINAMGRDAQVHTAALVVDGMAGTHVVPAGTRPE